MADNSLADTWGTVTSAWFGKVLNTNYNLELHTTADFDAEIVTDVR